jgi:hypothetical protein
MQAGASGAGTSDPFCQREPSLQILHTSSLPCPLSRFREISSSNCFVHIGQGREYGRFRDSLNSLHVLPSGFLSSAHLIASLNSVYFISLLGP